MFDPFEEVTEAASSIKDQILEVLGELGISGLPELMGGEETPSTTTTPKMSETQTMQAQQTDPANTQASSTMNDPSVENQGVVTGQSQATQPKGAPQNFIENILNTILSPPANRSASN